MQHGIVHIFSGGIGMTGLRLGITGVLFAALFPTSFFAVAQTIDEPNAIESRSAQVEGIGIHYLIAGHGPAVILLHAYTQTSRMWLPLLPMLFQTVTLIAPHPPST